jgi:hypothetical protein
MLRAVFPKMPGHGSPPGHEPSGGGGRGWRAAVAVFAALLGVALVPAVAPGDAQAIPGVERESEESDKNFLPFKTVTSYCPSDKRVVGGGGAIVDGGQDIARFTALRPVIGPGGPEGRGFTASAQTVFNGQYAEWSLVVYAVCADKDALGDDYDVAVEDFEVSGPARFVAGSATCPSGTKAYGAGGGISYPHSDRQGRIGLQMIRTSGPMDIGRATARENTPLDTPNPWSLRVYAMCAPARDGLNVQGAGNPGGEQVSSECDGLVQTYVHGAGGGASGPGITDAGPSWLKVIQPSWDLKSVAAVMAGSQLPLGGVITSQTCARGL